MTKIIFFDGVCSLCNGFIDFLIKRDRKRIFKYAPLQGTTSQASLHSRQITDPKNSYSSVIYLRDGVVLMRSTAVINILSDLGGTWKFARVLLLIPRFIRDPVYSFIARNRYTWFGKRDTCRVPTKEERALFLD